MEIDDLMLNDWVAIKYKHSNESPKLKKVSLNLLVLKNTHREELKIYPININNDILKLNGFTKYGNYSFQYENVTSNHRNIVRLTYDEKNNESCFDFYKLELLDDVEYYELIKYDISFKVNRKMFVSEFQQTLRLCGLNELANNFILNKNV